MALDTWENDQGQNFSTGSSSDWTQTPRIEMAEVLSGLSTKEVQVVIEMIVDRTYVGRSSVFSLGDEQEGLYLVKQGLVEEFRLTEDGYRLPINQIGPGKFLALASVDGRYCCFAETVEESVVGLLSFRTLEELYRKYPRLAVNMVKVLARRLGDIEERLELLAFSNLRSRIAWALLELYATHGPHLKGVTHEALGAWAVSSRPKVSVVLGELQERGLLRLSRGAIELRNPAGLERWARKVATG